MGPTWGPPGSCRPQVGHMLAPRTLLSGEALVLRPTSCFCHRQRCTQTTLYRRDAVIQGDRPLWLSSRHVGTGNGVSRTRTHPVGLNHASQGKGIAYGKKILELISKMLALHMCILFLCRSYDWFKAVTQGLIKYVLLYVSLYFWHGMYSLTTKLLMR